MLTPQNIRCFCCRWQVINVSLIENVTDRLMVKIIINDNIIPFCIFFKSNILNQTDQNLLATNEIHKNDLFLFSYHVPKRWEKRILIMNIYTEKEKQIKFQN